MIELSRKALLPFPLIAVVLPSTFIFESQQLEKEDITGVTGAGGATRQQPGLTYIARYPSFSNTCISIYIYIYMCVCVCVCVYLIIYFGMVEK
jgi:hypothetical protein